IVMDNQRSQEIAWLGFSLHIFRMTTFFLLAGYFGHMVFHRNGALTFIKSRLKRIALPLLIFWFPMIVSLGMIAGWGISKQYGIPFESLPPPPPLTVEAFPLTHLWFLYLLLVFYAAMLILRLPVAVIDRGQKIRGAVSNALTRQLGSPLLPLLLAIPVALSLLIQPEWVEWFGVPTPDFGFMPQSPALVTYGIGFWLGWVLHRQDHCFLRLTKIWLPYLGLATACTIGALYLLEWQPRTAPFLEGNEKILFAALYALSVWLWTFGLIGLAMWFFTRRGPVARYIADSSYWLYLIHLPIVMAMQVWVLDWSWPALAKYGFILGTSVPVMLLSYQVLVRHTFVGSLLNSPRKKKVSS
ncbi:MAG: acyltransferase, partial [Pseudomonadota bacterium]